MSGFLINPYAFGNAGWSTWDGTLDGSPVNFEPGSATAVALTVSCLMSANTMLVCYKYNNTLAARIITTSGTTPTSNTEYDIDNSGHTYTVCAVCAIDSTRAMFAWRDSTSGIQAVVLSISGTTITVNTPATVDSSTNTVAPLFLVKLTTDQCVLGYNRNTTSVGAKAVCLSTPASSTTVTVRTPLIFDTSASNFMGAAVLSSTAIYVGYEHSGGVNNIVLSISGDTITAPTATAVALAVAPAGITVTGLDSTHAVIAFKDSTNSAGKAICSSISGTTITNGAVNTFESVNIKTLSTTSNAPGLVSIDAATVLLLYRLNSDGFLYGRVFTISGTTLTALTKVALYSNGTNSDQVDVFLDANRIALFYTDAASPGAGQVEILSIV